MVSRDGMPSKLKYQKYINTSRSVLGIESPSISSLEKLFLLTLQLDVLINVVIEQFASRTHMIIILIIIIYILYEGDLLSINSWREGITTTTINIIR